MKTWITALVVALGLSALALGPSVMAQQPNKSAESRRVDAKKDAQTVCMDMMQGAGVTQESKNAMEAIPVCDSTRPATPCPRLAGQARPMSDARPHRDLDAAISGQRWLGPTILRVASWPIEMNVFAPFTT